MADRHFRSLFRALHLRREQWTFLLMALLCVSVIVGTALWTRQAEFARVTPTPPVSGDISAAQLLQQSLDSAQTATPAPTVSPTVRSVTTPLESMTLLRPFDNTRMRQSSATGLWALHDAADYAGAEGAKVSASVVKNGKGKKVIVFKYKPKKGYRRKQGHRQPYTKVTIGKISV